MVLDQSVWGKSAKVHFKRANEALHAALVSDPEFAAIMEELIPGITNAVSSKGGRETPKDWTWHHASSSNTNGQLGVMQLVPRSQHTAGSRWWRILHPDPGAAGGYAEWARPNGAPPRK